MTTIAIASLGDDKDDPRRSLTSSSSSPENNNIDIQVTLSRSSFVAGGTVVGTVRLAIRPSSSVSLPSSPRDAVSSITLTAVGYCRLDPRWHKETEYHKAYCSSSSSSTSGTTSRDNDILGRLFKDTPNRRNIFWASSTASASSTSEKAWLELLNLPERAEGRWENVRPRSIRLRQQQPIGSNNKTATTTEAHENEEADRSSSSSSSSDELPRMQNLENRQFAIAFRIDLPTHLPPTLSATSCRYTYAILVRCVVNNNNNRVAAAAAGKSSFSSSYTKSVQWVQVPFVVLTTPASSLTAATASAGVVTTTSTINCQAFAHSAGLPFGLTSAEVFHPSFAGGNLTVHLGGSSFFGNLEQQQQRRRQQRLVNSSNSEQQHQHYQQHASLQTLRISNPAGRPVAVLTILGGTTTASSALYLSPGSRLILKLDFPQKGGEAWTTTTTTTRAADHDDNHQNDSGPGGWIPCYQVSACLQGEEIVVQPDGSRNTRSRQYYLSTAHQVMDPDCTESLSLDLIVPDTNNNNNGSTTPFSVSTNVVEVSTRCLVDLTVGVVGNAAISGYSNLRLEIPIQIGHCTSSSLVHGDPSSGENQEDVEDENLITMLLALSSPSPPNVMNGGYICNDNTASAFRTIDIRHDLKQLALVMADQCGLSSPFISSS